MTKRLLIALLSLGLTMHVSGCTSGGSSEDGDVAESNDGSFSEESDGDFADAGGEPAAEGEATDAGSSDTVADNLDDLGGGEAPADGASTDVAAADTGGEAAPADGGGGDELVLDTAEPLPEDSAGAVAAGDPAAEGLPADAAPPSTDIAASEPAPAPTDETVFNAAPPPDAPADTTPAPEPIAEAAPEPSADVAAAEPKPAPVYAPLKKVREQAYNAKDGTSLNRVYVARPGDTMKTVSQKIYGKNRSKDLKAWNGKSSVKTGDKLYYASPNDPEDTSMKTFYEDIGVQPSTYTSKDGDNIRQVSKQLLGSGQSWKEVWATNPNVESKGDIPAGLEIRYWPEGAEAAAVASTAKGGNETVTPPAPPMDVAQDLPPPPPPMDTTELPPPPTDMAMNDIPPPPTPGPAAVGAMDPSMNVPPPPPPDIPPPPPPEPKPVAKKMQMDKIDSGEPEADQMMWLGAGGIMLMAAAILYVVIKKNRAKRIDLSQTQV